MYPLSQLPDTSPYSDQFPSRAVVVRGRREEEREIGGGGGGGGRRGDFLNLVFRYYGKSK